MRKITDKEIAATIKASKWANICTVAPTGEPYAVEATPFVFHDETCFMINPRGGTWRSIQAGSQVLLKYTLTTPDLKEWVGVSCFGVGRFIIEPGEIKEGWRLLGMVMGQDYSSAGEKFSRNPARSPLFAVKIHTRTGRCSAAKNEQFPLLDNIATLKA